MKLEQGQIWQKEDTYYRIVTWSRQAITYKEMTDPASKLGSVKDVTKKEFCRLIKDAVLLGPEQLD